MRTGLSFTAIISGLLCLGSTLPVLAQAPQVKKPVIPHAQDKEPNEPRDPGTAAKMMTVPEGFSVEVVAAEPDIVNPVAMAIDERGRFWITESLEYPRREPGVGKDRVKICEDTDGDGKCDKFTVFLDGLNIPSGVAVGHGGVWIANSPDILFVPDADRDGKPDGPAQVVVTGFGRTDTHELPNSLTWGPDGWLYGLNGVFNFSNVTYPKDSPWLKGLGLGAAGLGGEEKQGDNAEGKTQEATKGSDGKESSAKPPTEFKFTCAMFRIHPRTREFQVFCEGTSNPWGIAFNDEGEAFISACVIDHLWHLVETGYYHRQGGPYPPFTWKIDSIVKHKHQKAAYCGIHYFDSDAYPEKYRGKLYMGNIHGGCINVDRIERDGSTYKGFGEDDFLTANDAWFMPVVQKTGPDGCLYILDWYDRYHCYQDANRDPAGIDRLKGRLYRVRYNGKAVAASAEGNGTDRTHGTNRTGATVGTVPQAAAAGSTLNQISPIRPISPIGPIGPINSSPNEDTQANPTPNQIALAADAPPAKPRVYPQIDLAKETDEQLIERLGAKNDFIRWTATRLLQERSNPETSQKLLAELDSGTVQTREAKVAEWKAKQFERRQMCFAIAGMKDVKWGLVRGGLYNDPDPTIRAWRLRMMADHQAELDGFMIAVGLGTGEQTRTEMLQAAIAARKAIAFNLEQNDPPKMAVQTLRSILARSQDDPILARIIWQNLLPLLETHPDKVVQELSLHGNSATVGQLIPRVLQHCLSQPQPPAKAIARLIESNWQQPTVVSECLVQITKQIQTGELKGERLAAVHKEVGPTLHQILTPGMSEWDAAVKQHPPLAINAVFLATAFGDKAGFAAARKAVETASLSEDQRLAAVSALIAVKDAEVLDSVARVLDDLTRRREAAKNADPSSPLRVSAPPRDTLFEGQLLAALARLEDQKVGEVVLTRYAKMEPDLQPKAVELLTQRAGWAKQLLAAVGEKKIDASVININQARRLKELKDDELSKLLATHWGQVREGRDPNREKYIADMKALIRTSPGDALAGEKAFKKVCAQCHKLYGEGAEVGPDITRNGRNDFSQLLSNVFDPSLVIGAGYRSYTVVTNGGRVINGLLAEDSPQRVVLKIQGGKQEVIARADIDEFKVSEISLMPEQLEKQLSQQEIIDLFAFITLDKHPSDPSAKRLPGVSAVSPKQSLNPADFPAMIAEILPGFSTGESGVDGIGLLTEHLGRDNVLRTHPVSRDKPCVLTMKLTPPADKKTRLILDVAHDSRGDWRLVVRGNGERLADEMISKETCQKGWRTLTVDLSKFAGKELTLGLVNQANDWSYEFGYWGGARVVSE